eukprot:COSAG01_NODE_16752_length_1208_cov_1.465284_1_plen_241_part_00
MPGRRAWVPALPRHLRWLAVCHPSSPPPPPLAMQPPSPTLPHRGNPLHAHPYSVVPRTVRDAVGEDMATGRGGGGGRVAAAPVPKSSGSGSGGGGGGMFGSLCGGMSGAARDEGQAGSSDDDSTDSDSDFGSDSDSSETDADRDLVRTAGRPAVPLGRQITVCNRRWHWELPAKGAVSRGSQGARECVCARALARAPACTTQLYRPRPCTCAVSRHRRRCVSLRVTASQVSLATMHHLQT